MTVTWAKFEASAPDLAAAGRRLLVGADGVAMAFLASAGTSGPHLSPICPIFAGDGLYLCAVETTPKVQDLRECPRYSLHAFLGNADEEFQVQGSVSEVVNSNERFAVHEAIPFQSFDPKDPIFVLGLSRAIWVQWQNPGQPDTRPIRRSWVAETRAA